MGQIVGYLNAIATLDGLLGFLLKFLVMSEKGVYWDDRLITLEME